jgi:hypothetical protein
MSDYGNDETMSGGSKGGNTNPKPQPGDPGKSTVSVINTYLTVTQDMASKFGLKIICQHAAS